MVPKGGLARNRVPHHLITRSHNDDINSTDPKQTPNPRPDPTVSAGTTGWLIALNSFLEHVFLASEATPDPPLRQNLWFGNAVGKYLENEKGATVFTVTP